MTISENKDCPTSLWLKLWVLQKATKRGLLKTGSEEVGRGLLGLKDASLAVRTVSCASLKPSMGTSPLSSSSQQYLPTAV